MPRSFWLLPLLSSLLLAATGCGGGGQNVVMMPTPTPTPSPTPSGTTVTVTFPDGTPIAVATQVGNGAFTSATPGGPITLTIPNGMTTYGLAYICTPTTSSNTTFNIEVVVESTIQDGTSLTESCFAPPNTGTLTGNVSSSITGTTEMEILGIHGMGANLFSTSGPFSASMPVGQNDVAVVALDNLLNVVGVKIVRSQTVPGTIGGGIVLTAPEDATNTQFVTVSNIPASFDVPPSVIVIYNTTNGTKFTVTPHQGTANPMPYSVVPAASTQAGDFYFYFTAISDFATNAEIGGGMTTTNGGGAVTLTAPTPWAYSGPTPAKLPTFTYNYSGFTGLPTTQVDGEISWPASATTFNEIIVTATANFLNGANTLTIPDLSGVPGFLAPAPSGTTVNWFAIIFGGNEQAGDFENPPANVSGAFVKTAGQFTQP